MALDSLYTFLCLRKWTAAQVGASERTGHAAVPVRCVSTADTELGPIGLAPRTGSQASGGQDSADHQPLHGGLSEAGDQRQC